LRKSLQRISNAKLRSRKNKKKLNARRKRRSFRRSKNLNLTECRRISSKRTWKSWTRRRTKSLMTLRETWITARETLWIR